MKLNPAEIRKALMAAAAMLSQALAVGLLSGTAEKVAMVLLAAAGVYGVWRVPNQPASE